MISGHEIDKLSKVARKALHLEVVHQKYAVNTYPFHDSLPYPYMVFSVLRQARGCLE
jgi:hypothetical protein